MMAYMPFLLMLKWMIGQFYLVYVPGLALAIVVFVLTCKVLTRTRCDRAALTTAEDQTSLLRLLGLLRGTAWTAGVVGLLLTGGLMCGFIERIYQPGTRAEMAFVVQVVGPGIGCMVLAVMTIMLALGLCYVLEYWLAGKRLEAGATRPARRKSVVVGLYLSGILVAGGSLWGVTSLFAGPTFSEKFDQAVEAGDVPRVKALLAEAYWNELDVDDATARAAGDGNLDLVKLFDPDDWDAHQRTIMAAAWGRQKHVFRWVVDRMSMDQHDRPLTPLHLAVLLVDADLVTLTIDKGADVNAVVGPTPERELYWDQKPAVCLDTPLHLAARFGESSAVEITRILLDHGARVNVVNFKGDTPLDIAMQSDGDQALISLLRERGTKTRDELDKLTTRPSE